MAKYNINNFLVSNSTDRSINIIDEFGVVTTIRAYSIMQMFVINNLLKIKTKYNEEIITLEFNSNIDALSALKKVQTQLDTSRTLTPFILDDEVKNYVNNRSDVSATFSADGQIITVVNGIITNIS